MEVQMRDGLVVWLIFFVANIAMAKVGHLSMSEVALVSVYQMVIVFAFAGVTGLRKS